MIDVSESLERAEGFLRAGDYLEAQARVRRVRDELRDVAEASTTTRTRVERTLRRCDTLAREWQAENAARSAAHVARERKAIGADAQEPTQGVTIWSRAVTWLRSARRPARRTKPSLPAALPGCSWFRESR